MAVTYKSDSDERERDLSYEKDPRFIRYMKTRLEKAVKDRKAGRLVNADIVFAEIRNHHGW